MIRCKNVFFSILFFLTGFYIRGIIDIYTIMKDQGRQNIDVFGKEVTIDTYANPERKNYKYAGNGGSSDDRTHWCVVASKFLPKTTRGHFDHFPHAAEIILPCWSYFVKENVTDRCGFALVNINYKLPPWIKELVDTMGCHVKQSDYGLPKDNIVDFVPAEDIQHIPNYYLLRPRLDYIRYLDHPEHAHMLRRMFVSDDYIGSVKGNGKPLQIGIIQRDGARRFDNLDEMLKTLKNDIPEASIIVSDFKFGSVKEQATWFATKDMVIASHGAALTNSIFITVGTIVLQMYPPGYFLQTLEPLIEQSGGIAIQWYEKGVNPYINTHEINIRNHTEFEELGQSGGFSPPPAEVSDRVRGALGIQRVAVNQMRRMFGHDV